MRRLAVLDTWRKQQESKFEHLKESKIAQLNKQSAHQARLALLEDLSVSYQVEKGGGTSALLLKGTGRFRNQLEHLVLLQRQELALSDAEMRAINSRIIEQHRNVKISECLVDKRNKKITLKKEKQEQKMLDELSSLRFLQQRRF